jgi:SAM-dependent methyltransferase
MSSIYDEKFFTNQEIDSIESSETILGTLFAHSRPASVIDVGCGVGTWAAAASRLDVTEVLGVDGAYVDRRALVIPEHDFLALDLAQPGLPDAVALRRPGRFDLAISMEVAEHLPYGRAKSFVADLCSLADVVLFSAAIPFQGGTAHINEQWPEFWATFFRSQGFACFDLLRPKLWAMPGVKWWYAQNALLFVRNGSEAFDRFPEAALVRDRSLALVHPSAWLSSILNQWHPYRASAREEEAQDLQAVLRAWVEGASAPPSLKAAWRAEAVSPDAVDTFPNTRMVTAVPEELLADAAAECAALRQEVEAGREKLSRAYSELERQQTAFDREADSLKADLARLRTESRIAAENAAAHLAAETARSATLKAANGTLREQVTRNETRAARAEQAALHAAKEAGILRERLVKLESQAMEGQVAIRQLVEMRASTSWRITAPMRALRRLF